MLTNVSVPQVTHVKNQTANHSAYIMSLFYEYKVIHLKHLAQSLAYNNAQKSPWPYCFYICNAVHKHCILNATVIQYIERQGKPGCRDTSHTPGSTIKTHPTRGHPGCRYEIHLSFQQLPTHTHTKRDG